MVLPTEILETWTTDLLQQLQERCQGWPLASWVLLQFQSNPVRQFQQLYCLWLAVALAVNHRAHVSFLAWFDGSGLELSRKRGLGAHPSKIYGVFWPPTLTAHQLRFVSLALISCLVASCAPVLPRVFLFAAYVLSLCYFPQLFAEVTCSGHSTILIPSILFILACTPSLDHEVQSRSEWPLHLIRIYIASGYFSSGMCKVLCGLRFGRFWGKAPTLQMYIYDSMWSRPAGPLVRSLQRLLLQRMPWLLTLLATGSMAFEACFILAPTSDMLSVAFGLGGFGFHLGIKALQGLDFATFWLPALLAFVVGVPSREPAYSSVLSGWENEAAFFVPAAIYTFLQVLTALTLRDFWLEDVLPFSCCPMFMLPRNPFDEWPKWWTMTDAPLNGSTRRAGAMEPLYWSPCSPVFDMPDAEASKLPQRVVWFGSTQQIPKEVLKFIKPECRDLPFLLQSNFEISTELKELLRRVVHECTAGEPKHAWESERMGRLLDLQDQCLRAFEECAARSREHEERKSAPTPALAGPTRAARTRQSPKATKRA
jgi:hypothetical protein